MHIAQPKCCIDAGGQKQKMESKEHRYEINQDGANCVYDKQSKKGEERKQLNMQK